MHSLTRRSRALSAVLLALTVLPGVAIATASPAAADPLPIVTGVEASVSPSTPMWVIDYVFTLSGPVACPATGDGPEIHYRIGLSSAKVTACAPEPGLAANQVVVHLDLLASGTDQMTPSRFNTVTNQWQVETVNAAARILPSGTPLDTAWLEIADGVPTTVPTAPVWIGMGDGYSSQVRQTPDACDVTQLTCYDPNDRSLSWIGKAVDGINTGRPNHTNKASWTLQRSVIAMASATTSDVASGQRAQMETELAHHVVPASLTGGRALPSWNWVSVSAGLVDVGIPALMQNYATTRFPYATSPVVPWAAADMSQCPDLSSVQAAITTAGPTLKGNLSSAVTAAKVIDRSVHVVQVLYPYLTQTSNVCATGAASNKTVMENLNLAIDIAGADTNDAIVALNLQDSTLGFGQFPTGDAGTESRLWLTQPNGYPYPSGVGTSVMGESAVKVVRAAAADVFAPDVRGQVRETPTSSSGARWWNGPVHIDWTATDPSGLQLQPGKPWPPSATEAAEEGFKSYFPPYEACDTNHRCTLGSGVGVSIDTRPPVPTVSLNRDADDVVTGWYGADSEGHGPIVFWGGDDGQSDLGGIPIAVSDVDPSSVPPPFEVTTSSPNPQPISPPGTQICDKVGNCNPFGDLGTFELLVDLNAPTVTLLVNGTETATPLPWYRTPVNVTWTAADTDSGIAINDVHESSPVNGVRTFTAHVCDVAGNCTDKEATIGQDAIKPVVQWVGSGRDGDTFPATAVPQMSCVLVDEPLLSGVADNSCTVAIQDGPIDPATGRSVRTYTANGTDIAGNPADPSTIRFTLTRPVGGADDRLTGQGEIRSSTYGKVGVDLSLRCSGGASAMTVGWEKGIFALDTLNGVTCTDDDTVAGPGPFDTLVASGTGQYCKTSDGRTGPQGWCTSSSSQRVRSVTGTVTMTLVDGGSGTLDSVKIVIRDDKGKVVLSVSGRLTAGNLVAADANGGPPADTTPPTVIPTVLSLVSPLNGWYRAPAAVSWQASDDTGGSGLASSTPPKVTIVSAEGATLVKSTPVCDKVGNCAAGQVTVKIDRTAPTVSIGGATNGRTYATRPVVTCSALDQAALSGLNGECALSYTSKAVSGGTSFTYVATASDKAGNRSTKSVTFKVTARG